MSEQTTPIRILHVDDDPDLAELVSIYLQREDERIEIESATTASDGLDRLGDTEVDCIVSDHDMPDQNGIEFLEAVREEYPDLPFILFTGKGSEGVASDAISAGVTDYLQKGSGTHQYTVLANRIRNAVERWRAEQEAERTRTRLEAITANSNDAILTIDRGSTIRFANQAVEALFGYDPESLVGEPLTTLMPPRHRDAHLDALEEYLGTDERTLDWKAVEFTARHREGHEITVSVSFGEFEEDGEQRFVGVLRDMSDRVRMEAELREREERFRQVAENIREVVWMSDPDKEEILYVNPAYEEIWGRSVESLYDEPSSFLDAIHPEDRDRVEAALDTQARGEYDEEYRVVRPDGELRWVHDRAVPVENDAGDVSRIVGVASDITERKAHERERERIIERVTDAIVEVDADWRFTLVNDQAEDLYEMAAEDLRGRDFWEVFEEAKDTRFEAEYREVMETREPTSFVEYFSGLDGWFDIEAYPKDDGGIAFYFIEVTEQRERQRELETERRFISQALDALDDLFYVIEPDGDLQRWNERVEEVTGYSETEIEAMDALEFFPADERDRIATSIERAIETGSDTVEAEIRRADGTRIPYQFRGRRLTDSEGELLGIAGIGRDLTELKEQERELRETKRRLDLVLEGTGTGIWEWNMEIDDVEWNETLERAFGLEPGSFEGAYEAFAERVHPDDLPQVEETLERAIENDDPYHGEFRMINDEGDTVWAEAQGVIIDEGDGPDRMVGLFRDITERRERENRLRGLNETTQRLMSADTRERVSEIGVEAAATILGLEANAIHLYDDDQAALIPVAGTDAVADLIGELPTFRGEDSVAWRVYEHGETLALDDVHDDPDIYNPETPVRSELLLPLDDHGILIAGSETPAAFEQRDVVFAEILADAITAALAQVERTDQLRAREQELSRQNERLEEFASIVSHDLRNPLNVAEGRVELAREECDSEHFDDVVRAHERMNTLIDDLLTLAREGETVGDTESIDLVTLTGNCWRNVATAEATLTAEIDRAIQADRSRLQQLLENLMRNAVEHGGEDVTVTIGALADGFYVEDDGPGIPEDERDDVFDAGYSTAEDGTGFGLSIVKQVAHAHGWDVRVTDGSEGGARFEITGVTVGAE